MGRTGRIAPRAWVLLAWLAAAWSAPAGAARATDLLLKDGRVLRGSEAPVAGLADTPKAPNLDGTGPLQLIVVVDDDLRRTFVPKRLVESVRPESGAGAETRFTIDQRVPRAGRRVASVGPAIRIDPFDEFGRRIFRFKTIKGEEAVIQGITKITPVWTQVEGTSHIWDMRISTSSIPTDVLHRILLRRIDPKRIEDRKEIASFYLQSRRYKKARSELEDILKAFPDEPDIEEQLTPLIRRIRQLGAEQLLSELQLRKESGQHRLAFERLKAFPSEDVAGAILQEVRALVQQYEEVQASGKRVLEQFDAVLAKIDDSAVRNRIEPIRKEIHAELRINTLNRMATFRQHVDDPDLLPGEKISFAISGWLLGSDAATEKLPVALSLYRVRGLIREYLNEPIKLGRSRILGYLTSEEGAVPEMVAGLIAHMKPPVDPPEPLSAERAGYYELEVPGLSKEPPVRCLVQLPPEYDPYRRYPTIVTLHGAGTTAAQQVDWWAGAWTEGGWRAGQATRHGYIVVAPSWTGEHQRAYDYSAREYAAVWDSLREACRRFAIDTDRVFLTGHSMGGDAAWDIGLAHPDLWAGVIPIVAQSGRYCSRYWENARNLPFYVVCGELDGGKLVKNAVDLDRYLTKHSFNCTVVEYRGRGHEHFSDEILRLFDWMGRFRRDYFPRRFKCSTMRPWDHRFWWVELEGLPQKSMVDPDRWPPPPGTQPVQVEARILNNNTVNIRTGSSRVRVWLSPEMVDFKRRAIIVVNGRRMNSQNPYVEPDLETLLECVRTRGDRQHPFWAKVEMPTGRIRPER